MHKVRILTGLIAASVAVLTLWLLQTPLLGVLLIFFSAIAAYEICHMAKIKNKPMIVAATVMAALMPPLVEYGLLSRLGLPVFPMVFGACLLMVVFMLARFKQTQFIHLLFALLAGLVVPLAFAALVYFRDIFRDAGGVFIEQNLAVFFLFFSFCCAWLTDAFAFLCGVTLGKHKMCPNISPKKTWEGAIGGVLGTTLANLGFAAMFNAFFLEHYRVNLPGVVILSIILCVVSMVGDLTASTVKRNQGIKDFGKLFPGHGGVMDRFDSMAFVMPTLIALFQLAESFGIPLWTII